MVFWLLFGKRREKQEPEIDVRDTRGPLPEITPESLEPTDWKEALSRDDFRDPCQQARDASMKCVYRNQKNQVVCKEYFEAYKECKKKFLDQRRADRLAGRAS